MPSPAVTIRREPHGLQIDFEGADDELARSLDRVAHPLTLQVAGVAIPLDPETRIRLPDGTEILRRRVRSGEAA